MAIRTTVSIPEDLLEAADRVIREGKARNRNELLLIALRRTIEAFESADIDAAFREMAKDESIRQEVLAVTEEFARVDWEALRLTEGG